MNKQLADFGHKFAAGKVHRHPAQPFDDNECARSMNSEAFSHFSMPSNNFINGLRVNVPIDTVHSSHEFSSMMRSNPTMNKVDVNLS